MFNDALSRISIGTAKTFEHLPSKFSFRAEGDGAFEPTIVDKFSTEAPAVESLDDRKFRAFLKKEAALQAPEFAGRSAEQGKTDLQEMVTGSLGEGWTVKEFSAPRGGTPNVVKLELRDGGASQEVYIDRYSKQPTIKLSSSVGMTGWGVNQDLGANLTDGAVDQSTIQENVSFNKYS